MTSDDYINHLLDLFTSIGACKARKMFGGCGFFAPVGMIGLLAEGRFFLKVDDETKPKFVAAGGEPFVYDAKGKKMELGYLTPPEAAFDAPSAMKPWAKLALEAATRAAAKKKPAKQTGSKAKQAAEKKAPPKKKSAPRQRR